MKNPKFLHEILNNSWIIALTSLGWFLLRTGTKPSRAIYPCQQIAQTNFYIFGFPLVFKFWTRFKKCPKFRFKVAGLIFLGLITIILSLGIYGFGKAKFISYFWWQQIKNNLTQQEKVKAAGTSTVVWVKDEQATLGYNNVPWENKADQTRVNTMVDNAIKALTDQSTVQAAWTWLFTQHNGDTDYVSGEKIAIKINNNNNCDDINQRCPMIQTIRAILRQLVNEKGIPQNMITIYETSRGIRSYQRNGIQQNFPNVQFGGQDNCVGDFGAELVAAKYLINMPLLSTHGMAGVTLSFKNHLGSTCCPSCYHYGCGGSGPCTLDTTKDINLNCSDTMTGGTIRQKTLLVVDDALYGLKEGGPGGNPDSDWQGIKDPYPSSIFMSIDPVAIDSVLVDYIESRRGSKPNDGMNPRTTLLSPAANTSACNGNYSTSCDAVSNCTFTYPNINLISCNPTCSGTPPPSCVANVDGQNGVNVNDFNLILANWNKTNDFGNTDVNGDRRINGLDLIWVIKEWGKSDN